jgi:hypothetical protein
MTPLPVGVATINHAPTPRLSDSAHTVASAERMLSEWFEAEVVLTSSGRSAMLLYLTNLELNRYRDLIALPRLISSCVLDVVIRRAFPVDCATINQTPTLTILYHQYGIRQTARPNGPVLEDICHAFFATPTTGARDWAGPAAVFSLPKFFPMSSMAGGLVMRDAALATQMRERRDTATIPSAESRHNMGRTFRLSYGGHGNAMELEQVYLARLTNPRIADDELGGLPANLNAIRDIARRRNTISNELRNAAPPTSASHDWNTATLNALPFAMPIFGAVPQLQSANKSLLQEGISAGIYQIDQARNMYHPQPQAALLLPCHHELDDTQRAACIAAITGIN